MWRNSTTLSFSSKLLSSSSSTNFDYFHYAYAFSIFTPNAVVDKTLSPSYQRFYSSSAAPSPSPSSDSVLKLGFLANKSDAFRPLTFKASDAIQLVRYYGRCYWELSKARLSMLVVATSGTGYVLGSGNAVDLAGLCCTCAGTMMVAASANSLNQVFEINNDAKMKRTKLRPLPSGRITMPHAVTWASSVGLAGTALLACKANMLAAGLAASNLVLYAFVYTPLKQIHPVNTWVGAIVGAIPPLLGWAAASGQISLNGLILPAALYFWQIPHFMALAYLCRDDYAAGGYKMFSLADASGQRTAAVAFRNCLYLVPLGFIANDWGVASGWFCLESSLITLAISAAAFSFYRDRTTQKARRMFYASLLYLPVFMSGLLFHRLYDDQQSVVGNPNRIVELLSFPEEVTANGKDDRKKKSRYVTASPQGHPPVAYASIAPFPFLPAPSYVDQ
ncbi:Protoheme IX farnesyltransferase [Hibiscus syriacus]|uniref:Heme O synthase n=1 Tax=Hibiscus syriacus TaxID=106335 RepID=A0A6A3CLT3_HIBSY|nr:protoheme IX farnesyltransferase, mitochondrial-like [Hibiscus syriacus]KAE8728059.1 Protoheme IX farnesyltransferase [Hibiscus syriacus]